MDAKFFSTKNTLLKEAVKEQLGISSDKPVILCLGGVEERKNTVRVLRAFNQLRIKYPQAQLVIAGGASILDHSKYVQLFNQTLKEIGLENASPKTVLLTGPVPNEWMPSLMQLSTVVVMASIKEGFGLVTLEALCAGTPIVASNIKPFTEYLSAKDCTWADPYSVDSISSAMANAIENFNTNYTFESAQKLSKIFSWNISAQKHASIYQSLLKQETSTCQ